MNRLSSTHLIILLLALTVLASCAPTQKPYNIGVSQCSSGRWRNKVNSEMLAAQHLYEHDVRVSIASCGDDVQLQIKQIDSLVNTGIDLLVVAPLAKDQNLTQTIRRVRASGIPVICFDRKTDTEDYTAFIGGNNVDAGRSAGNYAALVAQQIAPQHRPLVLEITGAKNSSPASERHQGFSAAMSEHAELEYISCQGDWTSDKAYQIAKQQISTGKLPDIVFCHNDGMATGVYHAVVETNTAGRIKIIGIDGMPGEGLEYVQLGHQIATYIYPTGGDEIVKLALNILTGKPYQRDNNLQGTLVVPENVDLIATTSDELTKQTQNLVTIQRKLEDYLGLYNLQNKIIIAAVSAIALLLIGILLIWRAVGQTRKTNKRIRAMHDEQTAFYTNARHMLRTPLTLIAGPVKELQQADVLKGQWQELIDVVGRNIAQLETVVSSVLSFNTGSAQPSIDDSTAAAMQKQSPTAGAETPPLDESHTDRHLQQSRLSQMKQDDAEELANVLIVDDNDDMRLYLRTLLADRYYVLDAPDGQSGLKLARECVPDIVVSDVMMPVMDGLQFCQKLKSDSITSHIPVILLTARSTEAQQVEGYEHGADAYITKPFSAGLLTARISNLLKNRQQLRHLADGKQEDKQPKLSTQDKLFADTLKKTFQQNMANPNLKMDDLGDQLGMSRVQLYRKVKALTGISPVELLREMRLQRGYTLLNTTTKSVSEIAFEVGFHTPSYFSNCFKKQFGMYPTELRQE